MIKNERNIKTEFKQKLHAGFTLMELLAVVAILAILAAFGFVNVIQYNKNLHQTEMDDTAREIFTAAQNHLTVAKASGEWDEFYGTINSDGTVTYANPGEYGASMTSAPRDCPEEYKENWSTEHDFRYIELDGNEDASIEELVDILLPEGSIDETLRPEEGNNHFIRIEYDAKTAVIYGVWYSDGKTGVFSSSALLTDSDKEDLFDKDAGRPTADGDDTASKQRRRDNKPEIGYYGGGTHLNYSGVVVEEPDVELINTDKLYLKIKSKNTNLSSQDDIDGQEIILSIHGEQSGKEQKITLSTSKYNSSNLWGVAWYEDGKGNVSESPNTTGYACYLLDSTVDGTTGHFASRLRDFVPGEDITVTVSYVNGTQSRSVSVSDNSLFAKGTDTAMAYLAYGRHIQNLSTAVSNVTSSINSAKLLNDIDWSAFTINPSKQLSRNNYTTSLYNDADVTVNSGAFYSVVNSSLFSFDGNYHVIDYLLIQEETASSDAGLIANSAGISYQNLTLEDPSLIDSMPTNASFFLGRAERSASFTNCEIRLTSEYQTSTMNGDNIGFFTGKVNENGNVRIQGGSIQIRWNNYPFTLNAAEDTGLLLGSVNADTSITIQDTNVVINKEVTVLSTGGNAGGLIGEINTGSTLDMSNSRLNDYSEFIIQTNSQNSANTIGNAGGLAGFAEVSSLNLSNVVIQAANTNRILVHANNNAGGLIGTLITRTSQAKTIQSVCYIGGNSGLVYADHRSTGGLVGRLESRGLTINDSFTTTYVYTNGTNGHTARAGGFIGVVLQKDRNTDINRCYYGGRTDDDGNYVKAMPFNDALELVNKGGYNIVNMGSTSDTDTATAGGFIGTTQSDATTDYVNVTDCYTTGSVYIDDSQSDADKQNENKSAAGGFVGKASKDKSEDNSTLVLNHTYSTGLVTSASGNSNTGSFIGMYTVNSSSRNNYYLFGINSSGMYAIGYANKSDYNNKQVISIDNEIVISSASDTAPFVLADGQTSVTARPYASHLSSTYPYQFVSQLSNQASTLTSHVGDWPSAGIVNADVAFIYYEKIEGDDNIYYNGYIGSLHTSPSKNVYQLVKTPDGTASDLNGAGFREGKGLHVIEDGYVLLLKNDVTDFNVGLVGENNKSWRNKIYSSSDESSQSGLILLENFVSSIANSTIDFSQYNAYLLNDENTATFWTNLPNLDGEILSVYQGADYNENGSEKTNEAVFRFNPIFADTIAVKNYGYADGLTNKDDTSSDSADYIIRSARQFNLLAAKGKGFISGDYSDFRIQQRLDIDFNKTFTNKQESTDELNPNATVNTTIEKLGSTVNTIYYGTTYGGEYVSLEHLTNPFISNLQNADIHCLNFEAANTSSLIENGGGYVHEINIDDSTFSSTIMNISTWNTPVTENIKINNVSAVSIFNTISGKVQNITANNVTMSGNGLFNGADQNVKASGIRFTNAIIAGNGFGTTTIGTFTGSQILNATINGNGFATTASGTINTIKIINAQIGLNGFAANAVNNSTTIDQISIYGDKQLYLANRNDHYYKPNENTIDPYVEDNLYGYNLVTIGLEPHTLTVNGDSAGFVSNATSQVNITNSFVTGKVYGNNAAGFAYTVNAQSKLTNCYANTIINATNTAAGFVYALSDYGSSIQLSHSLGVLSGTSGAGFAYNVSNGTITNSYAAIWKITNISSGSYIPFSSGTTQSTNDVLKFKDGLNSAFWDNYNSSSATVVTSAELKAASGLGTVGNIETHKYNQYTTAGTYPYPMPVASTLSSVNSTILANYGDWYDEEDANILSTYVKVQFFDEDGSLLSDVLYFNQGSSLSEDNIPAVTAPEGKTFAGWYTDNTDFSDENKIDDSTWTNVTEDINAYAHYIAIDGYVALHYVNPNDQSVIDLGVEEIQDGTISAPDLPSFSGYETNSYWNAGTDGSSASYSVSDGSINMSDETVHDLYMLYHDVNIYNVTIEIRADNTAQTYPTIYQSYVYEYAEGENYDITQDLPDFSTSEYAVKEIKRRDLTQTDSIVLNEISAGETAQLDSTNNQVRIAGSAINENITYVVLYTGREVTYQIQHIFKNSVDLNNHSGSEISLPEEYTAKTNSEKLAYAESNMQYSSDVGDIFTVTETRTGTLGEYVNLENEVYQPEGDNTLFGYSVVLNPDNNFVLNTENQIYTINYSRKNYQMTIDTNGAEVVSKSPVTVPYGASITADSSFLSGIPSQARQGYTIDEANRWTYTYNDASIDSTAYPISDTMPAANITATANWVPNATADYTVEVWMQKVDSSQKVGMEDTSKDYDYYDSFTVLSSDTEHNPGTGSTPDFLSDADQADDFVKQTISAATADLEYFTINQTNITYRNDGDSDNTTANGIVTINADGSTVYRIFYDRDTITFNFSYGAYKQQETSQQLYIKETTQWGQWGYNTSYTLTTDSTDAIVITTSNTAIYQYGRSTYLYYEDGRSWVNGYSSSTDQWGTGVDSNGNTITTLIRTASTDVTESYQGLYGQTFSEGEDIFNQYHWQYNDYDDYYRYTTMSLTILTNYILPDGSHDLNNERTLTLNCTGQNTGTAEIYHYQEDLNGNWQLKTTTHTSSNANFNLTDKYNGFTVYGFVYGSYGETITNGSVSINTNTNTYSAYQQSGGGRLNVFHKRNTNTITLMNVTSMENVSLASGYTVSSGNEITVKYEQTLSAIGLPEDNDTMIQYIPSSIDRNGDTTGYTFGGWYTSSSFSDDTKLDTSAVMPGHNIRLYAKWNPSAYTITYMEDTAVLGTESIERFHTISMTSGHEKEGYSFAGWYTDSDLSDDHAYLSSRPVMEDLTLYAKYEKAPGTNITYYVNYIYTDGTEAASIKTVNAVVGEQYEERPLDIANAICIDVRSSGRITGSMDGSTITFRYLKYENAEWTYYEKDQLVYTDLNDASHTVTVSFDEIEGSTTSTSKEVSASARTGYTVSGSTSGKVKKSHGSVSFEYVPNYAILNSYDVDTIYSGEAGSADLSFSGMESWLLPDGYQFTSSLQFKDSSGNIIETPKDVGVYEVEITLQLTNGSDTLDLYQRTVSFRILKKTVVIQSLDGTWTFDGETHQMQEVEFADSTSYAQNEGAEYTYTSSIRSVGSVKNEFTITLNDNTSEDNYNIYRIFGTLTIEEAP